MKNDTIAYFTCSHISRPWEVSFRIVQHSEKVKRILSRTNSSFQRRGLPPAEPKKVLKLHRTRDQILHSKQQNPRKFCRKEVSFVTFQRETSGKIRFAAQHNLPARKKRIRTNNILQYELKVPQSYRNHRFYHVNSGQ